MRWRETARARACVCLCAGTLRASAFARLSAPMANAASDEGSFPPSEDAGMSSGTGVEKSVPWVVVDEKRPGKILYMTADAGAELPPPWKESKNISGLKFTDIVNVMKAFLHASDQHCPVAHHLRRKRFDLLEGFDPDSVFDGETTTVYVSFSNWSLTFTSNDLDDVACLRLTVVLYRRTDGRVVVQQPGNGLLSMKSTPTTSENWKYTEDPWCNEMADAETRAFLDKAVSGNTPLCWDGMMRTKPRLYSLLLLAWEIARRSLGFVVGGDICSGYVQARPFAPRYDDVPMEMGVRRFVKKLFLDGDDAGARGALLTRWVTMTSNPSPRDRWIAIDELD